MKTKLPPTNVEAEESVLGAMLCSPRSIPTVLATLEPGDFYLDSHRDIFHTILKLWNGDADSVDVVTVAAALPEHSQKLHHMVDVVPVAANASHYAKIVKHLSICRSLIAAGQEITMIGYEDGEDLATLLDRAEGVLYGVRPKDDRDTKLAKDIAVSIIEEVEGGTKPGIVSTGYKELDAITGGLHKSNFIIVGARPGIGKTAVALAMAQRVSKVGTTLFFSLEMSRTELVERMVCSLACVPVTHLRNRDLTPDELANIYSAMGEVESSDLRIVDDASMTVMRMKAKVREYAAKTKVKLIVVDYLQLMTLGMRGSNSRQEEVSSMSREMKCLARDTGIPIVALSQLNRISTFDNAAPDISHLRESGSLEQDADMVWLLSWPRTQEFGGTDTITIEVAKNRHGNRGKVDFPWNKQWQRIEG